MHVNQALLNAVVDFNLIQTAGLIAGSCATSVLFSINFFVTACALTEPSIKGENRWNGL